jgi:hypothetical protein
MDSKGNSSALLPPALDLILSTAEGSWKCPHCIFSFKTRKSLSLHIGAENSRLALPTNPYKKSWACPYVCKTCKKRFDSKQGLNQHIGKKHRSVKNEACELCGKMFTHKYALKFHIGQVHAKSTRAHCKYCEKSLYNKYVMKQHERVCRLRFPH